MDLFYVSTNRHFLMVDEESEIPSTHSNGGFFSTKSFISSMKSNNNFCDKKIVVMHRLVFLCDCYIIATTDQRGEVSHNEKFFGPSAVVVPIIWMRTVWMAEIINVRNWRV